MTRKQRHPARLHKELWFNEPGQMNDGPFCRCSWKTCQKGIAHNIYPGEKLPPCRVIRWNIEYRIVLVAEEAPELFVIEDLNLFRDYFFVELLELYDVDVFNMQKAENTCSIFHVMPRFTRSIEGIWLYAFRHFS
ncbi:unnamed protein product [Soboliphyme baturini]|uniref:CUB domain-containing protein n=1 Tax=Soboliphyme baturini TaxID=241478 RepID=A0A183J6B0_9BILA|nr:unnamed protein product [Soboliphyme baturini]